MECCVCYKNDALVTVCSNKHVVCRGCLELLESASCPLCRETMTLPDAMSQTILKNQEKTKTMLFLRDVIETINRFIVTSMNTHNLPKNSLPDTLSVTIPEIIPEDFSTWAMAIIFSQIKQFALDRNYKLKSYPYTILKISRGEYSLSEVVGLPPI